MKGSDDIKMNINIGGEIVKLNVKFDDQNDVRDTERAVRNYLDKLKKSWPDNSERNLLAMALFQFAGSYHKLLKIQQEAIDLTTQKCDEINQLINNKSEIGNRLFES